MKAWKANVDWENCSVIVFAETRGEARQMALSLLNEWYTDCRFIDVKVRRVPQADSLWLNRDYMLWDNPEDRLFLVKELGWYCEYPEYEICEDCIAKEYCDYYNDILKGNK